MGNTFLVWAKKVIERWYLLITEKFLFWTFWGWEIRSFFEPKSWWKDDIYWLLKSSCVEVFGDWKYRLFWVKMLLEKWYLLINEKLFSWTFRRWEIRSILSQKVDGKMIFTGYWKCLLFNISVMGNTVFFKSKS